MSTVTLSDTFQVHVPADACEALPLKPGDKLALLSHPDRLELVPIRPNPSPAPPVRQLRGALRRMSPDIERDQQDRL